MASPSHRRNSEKQERRETILFLILPMIIAAVMVLGGGVIALMLPRRLQVSILSDWMISIMVMCPAVLCLFAIGLVLIIVVAGMNKLHHIVAKPLDRLEDLSETLVEKTEQASEVINQTTINISAQLAPLDRVLGVFDEPPPSENGEEKHV